MDKVTEVDGKECQPHETLTVDHVETVFVVKIRSLQGIGEDRIKDLIQTKFEVVEISQVDNETFVKRPY